MKPQTKLIDEKIGSIVRSFDPTASAKSPHLCSNDVAVAKFDRSRRLKGNYLHIPWNTASANRNSVLYLLGRKTYGHYMPNDPRIIENPVRCMLGGWRYVMEGVTHAKALEYEFGEAIIWRCREVSIKGASGSLLVKKGEKKARNGDEWFGVGFQSHEISDTISPLLQDATQFWKVAFNPPQELVESFKAVAPVRLINILNDAANGESYVFFDDLD